MSTTDPIGRILVENVFTVTGDAFVSAAAALMVEKRISCLPVSMGQGAIGIITEKDILAKVVAAGKDPRKVRVKEIMSTPLLLIPADATIRDAAEKMLNHNVRRLIVTDSGGRLAGLVTMTDIVKWVAGNEGNSAYVLRYLAGKLDEQAGTPA